MELELGLKITRTRDDVSSSVDFHFSKDPFGPLVLSRETDSRFIIIIHLKGFKREGIEIDINEEGNRITIKGRRPVEEMVMVGWMAWRNELEFRVFKKFFRIPETVVLDEIKARFDDDDATLTVTMPKRVKGITGFNIEEEEERVDKGEVEEESIEREEYDVNSEKFETETQNVEEFGAIMEGEEKGFSKGVEEEEFGEESQVLGEEQKDEEETYDGYFQKSHQIDEQDIVLERKEEEKELADSNKESEDNGLRKPSDIEGRGSHEQTRHGKQGKKEQLVEAENKSDDFGSRAIAEQEPDEQLDRKSENGAKENKTNDDDGDGLSKVQGIEERERRNDERKIQDMVQGKRGEDKKKIVKSDIRKGDRKEDVEGRMGEGFTPNIDTTQVHEEDDITETEKKADGFEPDEVDKIHELSEKKEEKAKVIRQIEEYREQHSMGEKTNREHEKFKELVEDETPKAETDIRTNITKPVMEIIVPEVLGKTGDEGKEGKEKQNIVKDIKNGDVKEKIDVKMDEVVASNIADTAKKSEDFESDKLESDEEVNKIKNLVEKKDKQEENAKGGAQSEETSLTKLQEIGEQQFQGQKQHDKEAEIQELVEEQAPKAETTIGNDMPNPVQERCEGKHKIQKLFQEETKNQQEEYKEKIKETKDAGTIKVQEITRQQDLDEPARSGKESKTWELVKNKGNYEENEEKEIAETETKVQESNRPKMFREQEKIQEVAEEKINLLKNGKDKEEEEIAEKKTEFGGDDNIPRKVRDSDAMKGPEEKDMIQELVLEEKVSDGGKGIISVSKKKAENDTPKKVQDIDEKQSHEECGKQFQELIVGEVSGRAEVEDVKKTEEEKGIRDTTREGQETVKTDSDVSGKYSKGTMIQELDDNREMYRNEHEEDNKYDRPEKITGTIEPEMVTLNSQLEQDHVEDGEKTQELVEEEIKDCKEEEGSQESKIKPDDDILKKVQGIIEEEFYEPKREHISKIKEFFEEKTCDDEKEEEKELADSKMKAVCSSLRKVDGSEEQKLHEPKIDKERDKTRITGAERQSGQEKKEDEEKTVKSMTIGENAKSTNFQEVMEERHENPERHEKGFKIQEVVEAGHDNHKEEREEKVMANTELGTEEESSKKVQKNEQQEYDGLKRSMVQDRMQETGEKEKTKAIEEKDILENRKKTKDCSLRKVRDDEDPELSKPGGDDNNDHKEEQQDEKATAKAKLKLEEDSSKKVQEIEKQEDDKLRRSVVQEKMRETEERDKTREMEENEIVERRKKIRDGNLRKVQEGEDPELSIHKRHGEEDMIQEEVPNTRSVLETKELNAHVQELEGKTENCRDLDGEGRRGEKGKQWKTVETMSRKRFKTKLQESNEKKNQEAKEPSIHEVKLVTENDSLRKGQEFVEKDSNMSKKGLVKQEKIQQPKKVKTEDRVSEDEEQAEAETKINDGKASMNEEQKKRKEENEKIAEEKLNAPEKEAEANEKIAEEEMQDKIIDSRVKDKENKGQEPYELLKHGDVDKIPEHHREEEKGIKQREIKEMERATKDVNLRKEINNELEKHRKPSEILGKHNIQVSVEEELQKHREKELDERGGYKAVFQEKSLASRESQSVEEKGSNQQELMTEKDRKEEYHIKEGDQKEVAKRLLQVESKANDDSSENNETEGHESMELLEQKKKENHQELVDIEPSDQRKEEIKEEKVVGQAETIEEYDSARKIHGLEEERKSDKMSKKPSQEETSDDVKEAEDGNRSGGVWREGETKIKDGVFEKVRQIKEQEQHKKQSLVEMDTSGKAKENKNQVTKKRYDSSGNKSQEDEKQESHGQTSNEEEGVGNAETVDKYGSSRKIHGHEEERKSDKMSEKLTEEETSDGKEVEEGNRAKAVLGEVLTKIEKVREIEKQEQDKKQSFMEKDTSGKAQENKNQETKSRDESSGKTHENEKPGSHEQKKYEEQEKKNHGNEHKEIAELEVPRKLKGIEKRDSIKDMVEENNQEGEETKSMILEVLKKAEDDESKRTEGLRKEDRNSEQRLRYNLKDEKTAKTETKSKDNESRKVHEIKEEVSNEQERLKEQGTIKELVEDRTHSYREEDGSSNKIQERDREESTEAKIQERVDSETREDNEEELEIEFEDEEEDWEAEVIQEVDSDEDTDNIRKIKRIRLGFRLVGGSTFCMSLIVIVISFIRSKRRIKCYKF